jgi:hypothetical protein
VVLSGTSELVRQLGGNGPADEVLTMRRTGAVLLSLLVVPAPVARATPAEDSAAVVSTVQQFFRVSGGIARVWAPYDFWRGATFSHRGVDAFDLVMTESGWKISGATYTVEPRDCQPSPLGPPAAPAGAPDRRP